MTNVTAVLLVLTLTGAPAGTIVCNAWCQHMPATAGHCHGDMTPSAARLVSALADCADTALSEGVYVAKHRTTIDAAVLDSTASPRTALPPGTVAPTCPPSGANAWLKPPLVLRI